jgi:hypothetical protein
VYIASGFGYSTLSRPGYELSQRLFKPMNPAEPDDRSDLRRIISCRVASAPSVLKFRRSVWKLWIGQTCKNSAGDKMKEFLIFFIYSR